VKKVLKFIFLILVSSIFIVSGFAGENDMESSVKEIEMFVYNVENHFENLYSILNVMSKTHEIKSADWDTMKGFFESVQSDNENILFWFSNPDGSYYTVERGLTGVSLAQRAYFPSLLEGNEVYCDVVVGLTSKKVSSVIAIPVYVEDELVGIVGGSYFVESIKEFINGFYFKDVDVSYLITDYEGNLVMKHNVSELAEKNLTRMMGQMEYGIYPFSDVKKGDYQYLFGPSPNTGWKYALGFKK